MRRSVHLGTQPRSVGQVLQTRRGEDGERLRGLERCKEKKGSGTSMSDPTVMIRRGGETARARCGLTLPRSSMRVATLPLSFRLTRFMSNLHLSSSRKPTLSPSCFFRACSLSRVFRSWSSSMIWADMLADSRRDVSDAMEDSWADV